MVSHPLATGLIEAAALAESATPPSLPPAKRAAALMALVMIALIGVLFIAAILIGGHWVRRQGSVRRGPVVPPDRAPLARQSNEQSSDVLQESDDDVVDGDDGT